MKLILFLLLVSTYCLSQSLDSLSKEIKSKKTLEEREQQALDFSNIKTVLKNDDLLKQKKKNDAIVKDISVERSKIDTGRYFYPTNSDFWTIASELWLVKNAQQLNWDFPKPEYGIGPAFKRLLEQLGFYNKKIKVLIINTSTISHFALPGKKNEYIFLLSLPFMKSMDLTKVDLSLILLEDFIRLEMEHFRTNLKLDTTILGTNFKNTKIDMSLVKSALKRYTNVIYKEGFSFQQQYNLTKKMDLILKTDPALWGAYFRLLSKIDSYVKSDVLYKSYLKIYPSPELQLKWLTPKKKRL